MRFELREPLLKKLTLGVVLAQIKRSTIRRYRVVAPPGASE